MVEWVLADVHVWLLEKLHVNYCKLTHLQTCRDIACRDLENHEIDMYKSVKAQTYNMQPLLTKNNTINYAIDEMIPKNKVTTFLKNCFSIAFIPVFLWYPFW